jgi:alkanesulfonate monooxygenase SsuD/methylene tetrahydromethanopterin reductase-like flavin-dependent oxidoreductase (luciferase family)
MNVGTLLIFQNWHENLTDAEMYAGELRLAEMLEDHGFDSVWCVEHHFDDYSMVPDGPQLLAYLAGHTSTIRLGTGAIILPWNDPLRVAEKLIMLDHLSGGRVNVGFGRGLARMEYAGFRMDMGEARERYDEAAAMILKALATGYIEGDGPFYPQPRTELRPKPDRSFADRVWSVAMSPDSVGVAADLGVGMMSVLQHPLDYHQAAFATYRSRFESLHGAAPTVRPILSSYLYCSADPDDADEIAQRYLGRSFVSAATHYEFMSDHFGETKGYASYAEASTAIKAAGMDAAAQGYIDLMPWGTPDRVIERLAEQNRVLGGIDVNVTFSFGGLPFDKVEDSMKLFAKEVLPALKEL